MTAPKDRPELVELMVEAARRTPLTGEGTAAFECRKMEHALSAIKAAGCSVVPNEATDEMASAYRREARGECGRWSARAFAALVDASPYRKNA